MDALSHDTVKAKNTIKTATSLALSEDKRSVERQYLGQVREQRLEAQKELVRGRGGERDDCEDEENEESENALTHAHAPFAWK